MIRPGPLRAARRAPLRARPAGHASAFPRPDGHASAVARRDGHDAAVPRPAGHASAVAAVVAVLVGAGCAAPAARRVVAPTVAASAAPSTPSNAGAALPPAPVATAALPAAPDVASTVMGWVVLADAAPLVDAVARAAGGSVDAPPDVAVGLLVAQLAGIDPALAGALDFRRPAALALLNPSLMKGAGQPLLGMLPVRDRRAVERALVAAHVAFRPEPTGLAVDTPGGTAHLAFRADGYALVAFRVDLLAAAAAVLDGPLRSRREAPLTVHVALDNVYDAYGRELAGMLAHVARGDERDAGDPQLTFALRSARGLTRFLTSMRGVDVLVGADAAGVTLTARAEGKPRGEWAGYVASQHTGPAWGAALVPRDAVLVYSTRRTADAASDELDAAVSYLGDAATPPAPPAERARWRNALGRANGVMGGEVIYAIWPGLGGGVGLGGAYRVTDATAARREMLAVYRRIGASMSGAVGRALQLDPARFRLHVAVRPGAATVAGAPVDTVEVAVRWPEGAAAERARFRLMFGERVVLATTFVGDSALFAVGHDWRARLEGMAATARGRGVASLVEEPSFADALDYRADGRVSLTYVPLQPMARFLGALVREAQGLDPDQRAALEPLLLAAGSGAIVSVTNAGGARYEMTTHLPASSLPGLPRVGGVLWRIALSPLVNPPAMPPLPVPPAHVTPHLGPPRAETRTPRRHL